MSTLRYRPEIDGLRAVAVLSVIAFHTSERWLPGGYLGVDIFFVISGFLITSILLKDMSRASKAGKVWDWRLFYERRARRILPPLFTVLIVTSALAWLFFGGEAIRDYSESTLASLGFVANWHFLGRTGYFDAPAQFAPLLHIWSLGVEEQYYFLFPLLLWPLMKSAKQYVFPIIAILTLTSFGLFAWAAVSAPQTAFFGTHMRFWEIGVGSLLAIVVTKRPDLMNRISSAIIQIIMALGLVLIGLALTLALDSPAESSFDTDIRLAVTSALAAITGTALIVLAGHFPSNFAGLILGSWIFRSVGKISYALYLWHWPLLVFLSIWMPGASWMLTLCTIVLAVILSILSYYIIEQPIRKKTILASRKSLYMTALIIAAIIMGGAVLGLSTRPPVLFQSVKAEAYEVERMNQVRQFYSESRRGTCWIMNVEQLETAKSECLTLSDSKPNVLIIGDSHAAQFFLPTKERFSEIEISTLAANSCGFVEAHLFPEHTACRALMDYVYNDAPIEQFDAVMITRRLASVEQSDDFAKVVIDFEKQFGVPVIVMGPITFYQPNMPTLYAAHINKDSVKLDRIFDAAIYKETLDSDKYLAEIFGDETNIRYTSLIDVLCPEGPRRCRHNTPQGWPILIDNSHMSPSGVRALLADLVSRQDLILP